MSVGNSGVDARLNKKTLQALAPLPDTAMRLLTLLDNPNMSLRELGEVASHDVGISSAMLRMANSALFGLRGHVGSISDAVRVIGTAQARLLVLASGVSHSAQQAMPLYGLAAGALLKHSELVANLSMTVAYDLHVSNIGSAYTAGLLHDMGKIVINKLAQQEEVGGGRPLAAGMASQPGALRGDERRRFGFDHTEVGLQLAQLWGLPADLTEAIAGHHDPLPPLENAPLAWCVAVANMVAAEVCTEYPEYHRPEPVAIPSAIDEETLRANAEKLLTPAA